MKRTHIALLATTLCSLAAGAQTQWNLNIGNEGLNINIGTPQPLFIAPQPIVVISPHVGTYRPKPVPHHPKYYLPASHHPKYNKHATKQARKTYKQYKKAAKRAQKQHQKHHKH